MPLPSLGMLANLLVVDLEYIKHEVLFGLKCNVMIATTVCTARVCRNDGSIGMFFRVGAPWVMCAV